jgi:hypothetical protein
VLPTAMMVTLSAKAEEHPSHAHTSRKLNHKIDNNRIRGQARIRGLGGRNVESHVDSGKLTDEPTLFLFTFSSMDSCEDLLAAHDTLWSVSPGKM